MSEQEYRDEMIEHAEQLRRMCAELSGANDGYDDFQCRENNCPLYNRQFDSCRVEWDVPSEWGTANLWSDMMHRAKAGQVLEWAK